jgi:hypothetical protein
MVLSIFYHFTPFKWRHIPTLQHHVPHYFSIASDDSRRYCQTTTHLSPRSTSAALRNAKLIATAQAAEEITILSIRDMPSLIERNYSRPTLMLLIIDFATILVAERFDGKSSNIHRCAPGFALIRSHEFTQHL